MKKLLVFYNILALGLCVFCVSETTAQNRKSVSAAEASGTFQSENGSEFKILALGKGKLRVAFSGIYYYASPKGMTANIGDAEGEAKIEGDTAIFTPEDFEECEITIKFLVGGKIEVKQKGDSPDCGFGSKVSADGIYKKISGKKPKFDARN